VAAAGLLVLSLYLWRAVEGRWADYQAPPGPVTATGIYGWVRGTLPADAVLGARDAGKLGFFAGRPVVNLDGLITDQRLLAAIADETEDAYIAAAPIDYLIFDGDWVVGFNPAGDREAADAGAAPLPRGRQRLGAILNRLAARPGISLQEVPGAPDGWVILALRRQ
jgi:hypothetical protein